MYFWEGFWEVMRNVRRPHVWDHRSVRPVRTNRHVRCTSRRQLLEYRRQYFQRQCRTFSQHIFKRSTKLSSRNEVQKIARVFRHLRSRHSECRRQLLASLFKFCSIVRRCCSSTLDLGQRGGRARGRKHARGRRHSGSTES